MTDSTRSAAASWLQRAVALTAALIAVALIAAVLTACGGDDSDGSGANQTDRGFVNDMKPHHESAIDMARIALKRGQHPEIRALAQDIVDAQTEEIGLLGRLAKQLSPGVEDHSTLALDEASMGMSMDDSELKTAKVFDRAFIDMMVPHHRGAITMANVELKKGENARTKTLADDIVDAQTKEIEQMNEWRTDWYGAPVPDSGGSMSGMGMGG